MGYRVIYSDAATATIRKLDRQVSARILKVMDRVAALDDPRSIGEALHGNLRDYWKFRAGDWRMQCAIVDKLLIVEVIDIAHRSKAY